MIVGPSLDAEATVKQFKAKHNIDYPLLAEARLSATAYRVTGYPFLVLVGKDRKVLWCANFEDDKLQGLIAEALKAPDPDEGKAAPNAAGGGDAKLTVYVLKDGTRVKAQKVVDAGEEYSIKDENGKFRTIKKTDVAEVVKE